MLFKSFQCSNFFKKVSIKSYNRLSCDLMKMISAMFRRKSFSSFSSIQFLPKIHQMNFCLPKGNHFLQLCHWKPFKVDWDGQGVRDCVTETSPAEHFCIIREAAVEVEKKVKLNTSFLSKITKLKFRYINFMGLFWNFSS